MRGVRPRRARGGRKGPVPALRIFDEELYSWMWSDAAADDPSRLPWEVPVHPDIERMRGYHWLVPEHFTEVQKLGLELLAAVILRPNKDVTLHTDRILDVFNYDRSLNAAAAHRTDRPKRLTEVLGHLIRGRRQYSLHVRQLDGALYARDARVSPVPPAVRDQVERFRAETRPDKVFVTTHVPVESAELPPIPNYSFNSPLRKQLGETVYGCFGEWTVLVSRWWDPRAEDDGEHTFESGRALFSGKDRDALGHIPFETYDAPVERGKKRSR